MSEPAVVSEPVVAPVVSEPVVAPVVSEPAATNMFADMGDSWRSDFLSNAGFEGEELTKRSGQMERVSDMKTFATNYFSAQDKIRSGEMSTGLAADATPEQLTDWRAANGVPAESTGYDLTLNEGLVLGDVDKSIMDSVYAAGHAGNVSTEVMGSMVNAFLEGRELEADDLQSQDGIHKQQTETLLRKTWGSDFDRNRNMVQGLVNGLPETVRGDFEGARMADGRALFNSPEVMVFMADIQRRLNPMATVMPGSDNPVQATADRIKSLETQMREDSVAWHKDKPAQEELMRLYGAQQAHGELE